MKKYIYISGIIIAIIMIVSLSFLINGIQQKNKSRINVDRTAVIKELRELNRLETASFSIEKIIDAKASEGSKLEEFLFGDKLLLIAHGEVIAGIDLSTLEEQDIHIQDKTIQINLPAPEILVIAMDSQKTQVYDRQTGIFSKGDKNLESEARQAAESSIRQAACQGGILDEAAENARKQLTTLFQTLGFTSVSVTVPSVACS